MSSVSSRQRATMVFVRALTPIHVGTDKGLGAVNLPTMREAITGHPLVPGSSFKGVLRDLAELGKELEATEKDKRALWAAFGPSRDHASDYRGGLVFSDARLLLLPVASLRGTFVWTTSRAVLRRFNRDLLDVGLNSLTVPDEENTQVSDGRVLVGDRLSLRELLLKAEKTQNASALAASLGEFLWSDPRDREFFQARVVVLADQVFDAMTRTALELRARVAIKDETGTAEDSGPWLEEHIPAESVLAGIAFGRPTRYQKPVSKADEAPSTAEGKDPKDKGQRSFEDWEMLRVFTDLMGKGRSLRVGGHSSIGLGRAHLRVTGAT